MWAGHPTWEKNEMQCPLMWNPFACQCLVHLQGQCVTISWTQSILLPLTPLVSEELVHVMESVPITYIHPLFSFSTVASLVSIHFHCPTSLSDLFSWFPTMGHSIDPFPPRSPRTVALLGPASSHGWVPRSIGSSPVCPQPSPSASRQQLGN